MTLAPKVFVDSNIFKFSATSLPRMFPRQQIVRWGGKEHNSTIHDLGTINPNDRISNSALKAEVELLPKVAALASRTLVDYVYCIETQIETWGIPNLDSTTGSFYRAPCRIVEPPIKYSRVLLGHGITDYREEQARFLLSLQQPRFLKLQKITGAYQGVRKANRNQLLDAFHLWCAEHNKCEYFLSLDFTLARVMQRSKEQLSVRIVRPSELLQAIKL